MLTASHGPMLCYLIEIQNTLPHRHLPYEPAHISIQQRMSSSLILIKGLLNFYLGINGRKQIDISAI